MSRLALTLILVLSLFTFTALSFDTKEFFLGEWDIDLQRNHLYDEPAFGKIEEISWRIRDANETLTGVYIDEKDDERTIRIEFDGPLVGRFSVSHPEDEEEFYEVFAFEFGNRSTGCYVSQGPWVDEHRSERGLYELIITSPASFVLTLLLQNASNVFTQANTLTARKTVEKAAPSFLQRFGLPLAIVGFMIVSNFLKGRGQPEQGAPARRGGGAGATAGAATDTDAAGEGEGDGDDNDGEGDGEGEGQGQGSQSRFELVSDDSSGAGGEEKKDK
jgi:hypothetical protein